MSNEVFANGNEIACKSGDAKVIAAFPDVCLSPPSPPAGPIPIPYPNTSFSRDMKNGSKTVKIDGKEVMLKDKSFLKTSPLGNEAATKSLGAGVVSHVITGKTYYVAWSMDVKFEGMNVDRHMDLTTSNHASPMTNGGITIGAEDAQPSDEKPSPTYGQRRDKSAPCYPDGDHTLVCDQDVCPDCWDPKCEKNAKACEEEYRKTQEGANEEEIAASAKAANQKKLDSGLDAPGIEFENQMIDDILASPDHTIEKVGYKVHCTVCHLRIEIDIVTAGPDGQGGYVLECGRRYGTFKKKQAQLKNNIIPAAKKCFPDKEVVCATNAADADKLQTKRLDNWQEVNVKVFRL